MILNNGSDKRIFKLCVAIAILIVSIIFLLFCVCSMIKENKKLKSENDRLVARMNMFIREKQKNEEDKKTLHTGDSNTDFNNSIDLLQKYSKRNKT